MKVFVTGTRGIPDIPGGVEKHCQELYPRIVNKGHETILATRSCYANKKINDWKGVKLINCFAPRIKSFEALIHTFIALLKARCYCPDIVHIHSIGPSLLTPFARLMGLKVVVTNHGPEYNRQKWGKLAKAVLRLGEKMGGLFANEVIVISSVIEDIIRERCHRESNLIYNGVSIPEYNLKFDFLNKIGARPQKYILAVARIVPEKGLHDLIEAFKKMDLDYKLVIAGGADYETKYSRNLRCTANEDDRIILTGYITGEPLNQLYTHARLFVLPSYHEGLPFVLLEAMSYGIPLLTSDIPANIEVGLSEERYFKCGDIVDLIKKIKFFLNREMKEKEKKGIRRSIREKYDWDKIADQTINVYTKLLSKEY
jgi:glycosyltransferase involved in cell wall biosynthesis